MLLKLCEGSLLVMVHDMGSFFSQHCFVLVCVDSMNVHPLHPGVLAHALSQPSCVPE